MIGRRAGLLLALGSMLVLASGCLAAPTGGGDAGQITDAGTDGGPIGTDGGSDAGIPACPDPDGGCQMATSDAGCVGRTFSGFAHEFKCEPATSLWNGVVPDGGTGDGGMGACLSACEQAPNTLYCWFLDGTGGFPEDCRVCVPGTSLFNGGFGNDWAGRFNSASCP